MLNAVIRFALRHRSLIVVLCMAALGYGAYLAASMPIDVFPDLDRPRVVILTECRGFAPEEVETLVTQPIEIALLGANGVQDVRSQSAPELSVIYVEFDWTTEIRIARQTVQERLATLEGALPEIARPQMAPTASIMGQILVAGLSRQPGPHKGELAPVSKTGWVAERIVDAGGPASVLVWRPTKRRLPESWQTVTIDSVEWLSSEGGADTSRRAVLKIDGQRHEVRFPSATEQQMTLRTMADWVVRPRLLKLPGVAEIFILGGDRKQYQVLVDPAALLEYDVTLQQVEQALKDNNLNASGGFAIQGETERAIRILARLGPEPERVLRELRKIPIRAAADRSILLENVARVVEGPQVKRGDGSVNGQPGVVLTIVKQPHMDTRELTDRITSALQQTEASLPPDIVVHAELFRLKNFIDRGIYNVSEALVLGALLVLLMLFLFLLNFRTTFITLTAIPLSLVISLIVFRFIGWLTGTHLSINVMTLGGFAVAMGELVDDAIVDVENIFRRLRENNALPLSPAPSSSGPSGPARRSNLRVIYDASIEIRSAIVFGTAVVILVFLPLFALSGVEGRLFAPLGIAYIVSILASLLVSLMVTPVLSYYLLPQSKAVHRTQDSPLLRALKWSASHLVRLSMAHPRWLLLAAWLLVGISAWELTRLGADFLPRFDEGSIQVNVNLPAGSSLEASNQVSGILDAYFREMQKSANNPQGEILHFVRRTGRAELDEHAAPVNMGEYVLSMNPECGRSRDDILKQLLADLRREAPGVDIEAEQPLAHLISHMLSGVNAQIAVKIYGDDLDKLRQSAEQIRLVIQKTPGVTPPIVEPIQMTSELHIRLRAEDLAFYGVSRAYVAQFLQSALQGNQVSQVLEGERRYDLIVRLEETYRTDYSQLGRLRIDLPPGTAATPRSDAALAAASAPGLAEAGSNASRGQVELRELADIGDGVGPNAVNRENARRRIVIRCNMQGRDLASVISDIQERVASAVELPAGYFVEYGGQFESQRRATAVITVLAGVSVIGMFVVLLMLYPSTRITLQILNALPMAFIGGVLALVLTGQSLTVASLVGFISLGGIAVRNGILLVTHYFHLMREDGEQFTQAMILRGSLERLAPVLMTALTAGIGLLPLVIGGQEPGREILYPVATVILGGLITSTLCEFLIHPGLFWRFSGVDAQRLTRERHREEESLATPTA